MPSALRPEKPGQVSAIELVKTWLSMTTTVSALKYPDEKEATAVLQKMNARIADDVKSLGDPAKEATWGTFGKVYILMLRVCLEAMES